MMSGSPPMKSSALKDTVDLPSCLHNRVVLGWITTVVAAILDQNSTK